MINRRRALFQIACATFAASAASLAHADNKGKKVPPGQIKRHGNGAAKGIPPGQAKKWVRGDVLPADLKYDDILDLSGWKLKPPGAGNKYIKVDNEIYEIAKDTGKVVEAIGIVGDWLK